MSPELEQAITNAKNEIKRNKRSGFNMTNWAINKNIEMVTKNPKKFKEDFIKMYKNK